jgi:PPOX class probable F420-dependent enzyme
LSDDEAWAVLAASHTGIFTTLRRDGMPVSLPVWFVTLDRTICLAAPSRTKKVGRLRRDPRAAFLVESGERWAELQAVHCSGKVEFVDDLAEIERIDAALDDKYLAFRTQRTAMPEATQRHYAGRTFLRLVPEGRILSWDNRRIPLGGA